MKRSWSLRARVQATTLAALLILGAAVWTASEKLRRSEERRIVGSTADALATVVAERLRPSLEPADGEGVRQAAKLVVVETGMVGVVVFDAARNLVAAEPEAIARRAELGGWPADEHAEVVVEAEEASAAAQFRRLRHGKDEIGGAWLLLDRRPFLLPFERFRLFLLVALGVAAAGGLALAAMVASAFSRPLAELGDSMAQLGRGKLETRHGERGPTSVRRLSRAFNRASEQLELARAEQQRVAAELDHQVLERTRQLEQANRLLRDLANRDPLTGLANRLGLEVELGRYLSLARRSGQPLAVIMMDLDGFKAYNDACGHPAGDVALCTVGAALRGRARAADLVARLGGDEFCIVIPFTKPERAVAATEGFVAAVLDATCELPRGESGAALGASAGVACFPADASESSELLARADAALYRAKASGKGRVFRAGPSEDRPGES
ncbi:MAG TPA: diguanylate cyclase [Thermoanaerobaculaceae bacterium]|nr:diguanylate cyclase [Thermoanaerobaculaceae bacterium]